MKLKIIETGDFKNMRIETDFGLTLYNSRLVGRDYHRPVAPRNIKYLRNL